MATQNITAGTYIADEIAPGLDGRYAPGGITTHDPLTGRLVENGVERGDTGWRNIASLLINGWAVNDDAVVGVINGRFHIKRLSNQLLLRVHRLDPSASTSITALGTLGNGWRAQFNQHLGGMVSGGVAPTATGGQVGTTCFVSPGVTRFDNTLPGEIYGIATWETIDPWPTTLIGTQITPPLDLS